jgi:heme oxygenase
MHASLNAAIPQPLEIQVLDGQRAVLPLSQQLRLATQSLHQEVELALGLPQAIQSLADYILCLHRFYHFYRALETSFASFTVWEDAGFALPDYLRADRIAFDLETLGDHPRQVPQTSPPGPASLPLLPHFECALGALYVVEGSSLGSQYILRHLSGVLGSQIDGADSFFRGRGAQTGAHWKQFCCLLDTYGAHHPDAAPLLIEGAAATFRSIGRWMQKSAV